MGTIDDSMESIFDNLKEAALTMQQGGGVGYDFSTLRPRGYPAVSTGTIASGPVSFMHVWDNMCETILSTGTRRCAMMATLRCDHPDIIEFISAKKYGVKLKNFNLSILITDDFINAVKNDEDWQLVFPCCITDDNYNDDTKIVYRQWSGQTQATPCKVVKVIRAKLLWEKIMRSAYEYAEPGVLFIDRINHMNNLWYKEHISATNPCGEVPLPAYGACDLGSINLTQFVKYPFTERAELDLASIEETISIATRLLDNVIDISHFPLAKQKKQAFQCRRIGLGFTGLADALIMLGIHYGSNTALNKAQLIMKSITYSAYQTSIELAKQRGTFPSFDKREFLKSVFIQSLPDYIVKQIEKYGIRNSHLTAIAPTGTISLLANNVSSGIEPVFDFSYKRNIKMTDNSIKKYTVTDYAYSYWKKLNNNNSLPDYFVTADQLTPMQHLNMQSAIQPLVDNAISKTINVDKSYPYDKFHSIYMSAYNYNLKGCTTYRENIITGELLSKIS